MLKLVALPDPSWVELIPADGDSPALRVQFAPVGALTWRRAQRALVAARTANPDDAMTAFDVLADTLIRAGIVDWDGVGDVAGNPLPVTPETIAMFVANVTAFAAATRAYVLPWVERDAEKNVSSGAPNGISAGATPAPATATSPAPGATTDGAKRPRKPRPARTSPTTLPPTLAKPSGA